MVFGNTRLLLRCYCASPLELHFFSETCQSRRYLIVHNHKIISSIIATPHSTLHSRILITLASSSSSLSVCLNEQWVLHTTPVNSRRPVFVQCTNSSKQLPWTFRTHLLDCSSFLCEKTDTFMCNLFSLGLSDQSVRLTGYVWACHTFQQCMTSSTIHPIQQFRSTCWRNLPSILVIV